MGPLSLPFILGARYKAYQSYNSEHMLQPLAEVTNVLACHAEHQTHAAEQAQCGNMVVYVLCCDFYGVTVSALFDFKFIVPTIEKVRPQGASDLHIYI